MPVSESSSPLKISRMLGIQFESVFSDIRYERLKQMAEASAQYQVIRTIRVKVALYLETVTRTIAQLFTNGILQLVCSSE